MKNFRTKNSLSNLMDLVIFNNSQIWGKEILHTINSEDKWSKSEKM